MEITAASDGLQAQRDLVARLDESGWELIVGDAFVRGMRDIGYKSTSYALAELIDNSVQASATKIDVVFGFEGGSSAKPTKLAVIDDGHGMEPKMVRASLIWGAGTRLDNREGFGKYGYGLPSASVSQCYRVTVYSKTASGDWHSAYLDIDEISAGVWNKGHRIETPTEKIEPPPAFVQDFLKKEGRWSTFEHGTVVLWNRLDPQRIDYKTRTALAAALVTNLGVIYRGFLLQTPMTVDGIDVQPCDPLFLTEGFRYYDLDDDRAIALAPAVVEVKEKQTKETIGRMRVRYSRLPSTFFRKPEVKWDNRARGKKHMNERLEIADANNGIIFMRNGRQIDVLRPPRALGSINATTDRFWGVEVDFDATLDDEFSITTSKQQVRPSERIWDYLKDSAKIFEAIGTMRGAYDKEAKILGTKAEEKKRASVESIEQAKKFRTEKPPKDTPQRAKEAKDNLESSAKQRAGKAGLKPEVVEKELIAEREGTTHTIENEDLPGAPFFRCVQEGGTRVLYLNVAHPFYTELYVGPGSTPRLRAGLEIVLWALGEAEVDADPESDRRRFYERDRASLWSPYIADALAVLKTVSVVEDLPDDSAA